MFLGHIRWRQLVLGLPVLLSVLPRGSSAGDWPVIGGNKQFTRVSPGATLVPPLVIKWTVSIGGEGSWANSPLIVGATLYHGSRGINGTIRAIDAFAGTIYWTLTGQATGVTAPLYDAGSLYCGVGVGLSASKGRKLQVSSRSVIWDVPSSWDTEVLPVGALTYVKDGESMVLGSSGTLYCVDDSNGAVLWSVTITAPNEPTSYDSAWHNGVAFVFGHLVMALKDDSTKPNILWQYDCPNIMHASQPGDPTVANGRVYVPYITLAGDGHVDALDEATGHFYWSYTIPGPIAGVIGCAVDGSSIYFGSNNGFLYALQDSGSSASLSWKTNVGFSTFGSQGPVVAGQYLYLGQQKTQNAIRAVDRSGTIVWTHTLAGTAYAPPAFSNGLVYICDQNYIYCFGKPISVHLAVDRPQAQVGDMLTYSITLNSYGGPTASVTLVETLPPELEFVSASDGGTAVGGMAVWNGLAVNAATLLTVNMTARVRTGISPGVHTLAPVAFSTYPGANSYTDAVSEPAVTSVTIGAQLPAPHPLHVYPNPFNPLTAVRGTVKFDSIPAGATVRVFDGSGMLVWEERADRDGIMEWNGTNRARKRVASGLYFWVVRKPGGVERGRLIVQ